MSLYKTEVTDLGEIEVAADLEMVSGGVWFVLRVCPYRERTAFWLSVIDYTYEAAIQAVRNEFGEDTTILVWAVAGTSEEWESARFSEKNPFAGESLSGLDLEGFMEDS